MAGTCSFDVVSQINIQEVKNALNQTSMELGKRYDLKGSMSEITLDEKENSITIVSRDSVTLKAVVDIFQSKAVKRSISLKNFVYGKEENAAGSAVRQVISLQQGISKEKGKDIVKIIKELKFKVQAAIQEDQVRVSGKKRDDLQEVIALLKEKDFGVSLQFVNFR